MPSLRNSPDARSTSKGANRNPASGVRSLSPRPSIISGLVLATSGKPSGMCLISKELSGNTPATQKPHARHRLREGAGPNLFRGEGGLLDEHWRTPGGDRRVDDSH